MDVQLSAAFEHTGEPNGGMVSVANDCLSGDTILLATVTYEFDTQTPRVFQLLATAYGAADCDEVSRFYTDLYVLAYIGEDTPVETRTWGAVKALYR